MYSTLVLGLLAYAVYSDRYGAYSDSKKGKYAVAWLVVLCIHALVLAGTRPLFPFRTIWMIACIALIECAILAVIFFKLAAD